MTSRADSPRRPVPGSPFAEPAAAVAAPADYAVGDRVTHDRHGLGVVLAVGFPAVLRIDFGASGVHQLPATDDQLNQL